MTYLLQKALKGWLGALFVGSLSPAPPSGSMVTPQIFIGALPPKRKTPGQGEEFPFLVVRGVEGEDREEEKPEVSIDIIIGTWVDPSLDAEEGAIDIHRMGDKVRRALHGVGEGTGLLDLRYELQYPIKWKAGVRSENGEDAGAQPHPYYYMTIKTRWLLPPITNPLSVTEEVRTYGAGLEE